MELDIQMLTTDFQSELQDLRLLIEFFQIFSLVDTKVL